MTLRGVRARGAKTITSALLGTLRADPRGRAEFFGWPACRAKAQAARRQRAGKEQDDDRSTG
jgi:GTP cyclohydrolase I